MSEPIARVGGRVLIVDATDRVLLIHERLEDGTSHWLTPGGGVEGDESPRVAAQREAFEEVGIRIDLGDAEPVLVTQRLWSWAGIVYDQADYFYLARVTAALPVPAGLTDVERTTLIGHRWWTVAELRATDAVLLPPDLGAVLDRVLTEQG